jgi:ABC-2 type transport system permease protein
VGLLYGLLFLYGMYVAQGIVEEKSSRVVEMLLSTIRPVQLLTGKVLGLGLLGFLQVVAISAVGLGVSLGAGLVDAPPGTLTVVGLALAWFVLGYAQYASLFASVGAVASRIEELQGLQMLAIVPVVGAFFAASSALAEPNGMVAQITALTPFTAPLVQPLRTVAGVAPAWEPFAAAVISIVTAVGLVPLAARFYSGGVLQVRQRISFRAAWRAGA